MTEVQLFSRASMAYRSGVKDLTFLKNSVISNVPYGVWRVARSHILPTLVSAFISHLLSRDVYGQEEMWLARLHPRQRGSLW